MFFYFSNNTNDKEIKENEKKGMNTIPLFRNGL